MGQKQIKLKNGTIKYKNCAKMHNFEHYEHFEWPTQNISKIHKTLHFWLSAAINKIKNLPTVLLAFRNSERRAAKMMKNNVQREVQWIQFLRKR